MQQMGRMVLGWLRGVVAADLRTHCGCRALGVADVPQGPQCRGLKVGVFRNQGDKAIKELQRKVATENVLKEWRAAQYFIPPSQRRVLERKEGEKRRRRKEFKKMLRIVLAQKQRGY